MKSPRLFAYLILGTGCLLALSAPSSHAFTRGQNRGGIIVAHLDMDSSLREINDATYASRKELANDLDGRVKATHDALGDINTTDLAPEVRAQFREAVDAESDARTELNSRIRAVRNADVNEWEVARSALTDSYHHYSDAAARAEALADSAPVAPVR